MKAHATALRDHGIAVRQGVCFNYQPWRDAATGRDYVYASLIGNPSMIVQLDVAGPAPGLSPAAAVQWTAGPGLHDRRDTCWPPAPPAGSAASISPVGEILDHRQYRPLDLEH